MTALVERVVWVSLATSLLLLPLLGLSGAIRRRYRAGSCYLLWLVLALRLLIPCPSRSRWGPLCPRWSLRRRRRKHSSPFRGSRVPRPSGDRRQAEREAPPN